MRKLEISKSRNLKGHKEFNHLRISNLDEFFSNYRNKLDYYQSPFAILSALEKEIMFDNNPNENIAISYKPDGDILFKLNGIYTTSDDLRVVEYEYDGSVS